MTAATERPVIAAMLADPARCVPAPHQRLLAAAYNGGLHMHRNPCNDQWHVSLGRLCITWEAGNARNMHTMW